MTGLFRTICVATWLLILGAPVSVHSQPAEVRLLRTVNVDRNPHLDPLFRSLSRHTTAVSVTAPLALLGVGWVRHDSSMLHRGVYVATSTLAAATVSTLLKYTIRRERPFVRYPDLIQLDDGGSPSFPSGHTSDAFATATSLSLAFPKWYVIVPSYLWATGVGYSRMHLGVHYPTDVLGGAIAGSASAWITWKANRWITKRYRDKQAAR